MAVLFENSDVSLVSHQQFIDSIYKKTKINEDFANISIKTELFNIIRPFKSVESLDESKNCLPVKKRKLNTTENIDSIALTIKNKSELLIKNLKSTHSEYFNLSDEEESLHKNDVIEKCLNNSFTFDNIKTCNGGNSLEYPICMPFANERLILPQNCRFFSGDVRVTLDKLIGESYDFVVMDPPWWNKYIRRIKSKNLNGSYEMLYNEEIENLIIPNLMSPDALLAVWCTNCQNHENFVKEKMFPKWKIDYLGTWFWLKVTQTGIPVCPFTGGDKKQPFERLILGRKRNQNKSDTIIMEPPDGHIFISVSSLLHSHKPPLNDLLKKYIPKENSNNLEIFARYLLPNTTSVGYEPLKWQNDSLYVIK